MIYFFHHYYSIISKSDRPGPNLGKFSLGISHAACLIYKEKVPLFSDLLLLSLSLSSEVSLPFLTVFGHCP